MFCVFDTYFLKETKFFFFFSTTVSNPTTLPNDSSCAYTEATIGGIPAVFQGHLFIRPHQHFPQIATNFVNPLAAFVSTSSPVINDTCNLTLQQYLQFEHRHPSPPISRPDFSESSHQQNDIQNMVATKHIHQNSTVYELIHNEGAADMTPFAFKIAKKSAIGKKSEKCHQRKSASPNGKEKSKSKKKQKRIKKYEIDQILSPTSNGLTSSWEPVGTSTRKWVYLNNDAKPVRRDCFESIRHKREGEIIRVRDCVVIKSGENNSQQQQSSKRSYIGKIAEFFLGANGTLWASLAWYYWPEQAEVTTIEDMDIFDKAHPKELLASRHIDCVSVDSIEDVAYVITLNEYKRYVSENKAESSFMLSSFTDELVPRAWGAYPRRRLMPADDTDDSMVYFCRRVYDFHGKRLIRNPSV